MKKLMNIKSTIVLWFLYESNSAFAFFSALGLEEKVNIRMLDDSLFPRDEQWKVIQYPITFANMKRFCNLIIWLFEFDLLLQLLRIFFSFFEKVFCSLFKRIWKIIEWKLDWSTVANSDEIKTSMNSIIINYELT